MRIINVIKNNERIWLDTKNGTEIEIEEKMNGRYDVRIESKIRSQLPLIEVMNILNNYEIDEINSKMTY